MVKKTLVIVHPFFNINPQHHQWQQIQTTGYPLSYIEDLITLCRQTFNHKIVLGPAFDANQLAGHLLDKSKSAKTRELASILSSFKRFDTPLSGNWGKPKTLLKPPDYRKFVQIAEDTGEFYVAGSNLWPNNPASSCICVATVLIDEAIKDAEGGEGRVISFGPHIDDIFDRTVFWVEKAISLRQDIDAQFWASAIIQAAGRPFHCNFRILKQN